MGFSLCHWMFYLKIGLTRGRVTNFNPYYWTVICTWYLNVRPHSSLIVGGTREFGCIPIPASVSVTGRWIFQIIRIWSERSCANFQAKLTVYIYKSIQLSERYSAPEPYHLRNNNFWNCPWCLSCPVSADTVRRKCNNAIVHYASLHCSGWGCSRCNQELGLSFRQ